MKRTTSLKLQKPETGDVYSSTALTQNVTALGKIMGEIGGNTEVKTISGANFNSSVIQQTHSADWTINSGWLRIHGNGLATIYVSATSKKELTVANTGEINGAITICSVAPEYATAISQPLLGGPTGRAIGGYIAPSTTRIVLRTLFGYTATGKLPVGETVTLCGTYPLAKVPKGIGLEQMPPQSFNSDVHTRNLKKIDKTALKLKTKRTYLAVDFANMRDVFTPASGINVSYFYYRRLRDGTTSLIVEVETPLSNNASGDIGNLVIGTLKPDFRPDVFSPIATTSTYQYVQGGVEPNGEVTANSTVGKSVSVSKYRMAGDWHSGK